ncbi:MAG TPA: hypothetical protein DCM26_05825 [Desulfotomaculum sp.]|nr:hypothetical protein [Desulfotomaculum sp.]
MHIGVDIDGVIADTFSILVREMNDYFGAGLKLEDIDDYDIFKAYGIKVADMHRFICDREEVLIGKPVLKDGANKYLNMLSTKHTIYLVSAREDKYLLSTKIWLQERGVPYDHLILLGQHDKRATCTKMAIDLLVEDSLKNACQVSDCGIPVILLDAPYNQGELPPLVGRSYSWQEIYNLIERLEFNAAGRQKNIL